MQEKEMQDIIQKYKSMKFIISKVLISTLKHSQ